MALLKLKRGWTIVDRAAYVNRSGYWLLFINFTQALPERQTAGEEEDHDRNWNALRHS